MNAISTAVRGRPLRALALALALAWIGVVAYETLVHAGAYGVAYWYYELTDIVSGSFSGVVSIAGLCWLAERSRFFERET